MQDVNTQQIDANQTTQASVVQDTQQPSDQSQVTQVQDVNTQPQAQQNLQNDIAPTQINTNFKDIKNKVQKKSSETNNDDKIKQLINAYKEEYDQDEFLKQEVSNDTKQLESVLSLKNKDEIMLKLLESSVEKTEERKKHKEKIQNEISEIQKVTGYTEVFKKIDILKKDKNYSEVFNIIENISPKLAFELGKNLTSNFFNPSLNSRVTESQHKINVGTSAKVAISASSCVKKGNGYF